MPEFHLQLDNRGFLPVKKGHIFLPSIVTINQFRWKVCIIALVRKISAVITCLGPVGEIADDAPWTCDIQQGYLTLCSQVLDGLDLEIGFKDIKFSSESPTFQCPNGIPWTGISNDTSHFVRDSTLLVKVAFDCSCPPGMFQNAEKIVKLNMASFLAPGGSGDIVTFVLKNQGTEEFKAHKSILSCRSTVFKAMFENGMAEANSREVEITDMGLTSFKLFFAFLYCGRVELDKEQHTLEDLIELINAAEKYNVQGLKDLVGLQLINFCTTKNCSQIFQVVSKFGLQCGEDIVEFAVKNIKDVLLAVPQ